MENKVWIEWKNDEDANSLNNFFGGYVKSINISLNTLNVQSEVVTIGKAFLHLTNEKWINEPAEYSIMEHINMDFNSEVNWNETTVYEYLEDALKCIHYGTEDGIKGTVAVLHKIEIDNEYRGKGYFVPYMNAIVEKCQTLQVDYLSLQPHPFGGARLLNEHLQEAISKLRGYYERFGFRNIPITEGVAYMLLDLNYRKKSNKREETLICVK